MLLIRVITRYVFVIVIITLLHVSIIYNLSGVSVTMLRFNKRFKFINKFIHHFYICLASCSVYKKPSKIFCNFLFYAHDSSLG
jgi:hypothetical protein